jgi:hypothetical protein
MNTYPDIPQKTLAPFVAQLHFKPEHLWQGKHTQWKFRSDEWSEFQAPEHKQLQSLEMLIFKKLKGTFFQASLFDNRLKNYVSPNGEIEKEKANNLILQVYENYIKIDKRANLQWLEPTFDKHFLEYLAASFHNDKWLIDFRATHLSETIKQYKQSIYGLTT